MVATVGSPGTSHEAMFSRRGVAFLGCRPKEISNDSLRALEVLRTGFFEKLFWVSGLCGLPCVGLFVCRVHSDRHFESGNTKWFMMCWKRNREMLLQEYDVVESGRGVESCKFGAGSLLPTRGYWPPAAGS